MFEWWDKFFTEPKRRYKIYKARVAQMPREHRLAIQALDRYMMMFVSEKGDRLQTMLDDLADLFEQGVADGTPVRGIVGDDPVEFAEAFLRNYGEGVWVGKERERLTKAIDSAAEGAKWPDQTGPKT
jgi:DNA-binding ferritin-like protein (Dps family)